MPVEDFLSILLFAAFLAWFISLGVSNYHRRRAMTPEQRKAEDEANRELGNFW